MRTSLFGKNQSKKKKNRVNRYRVYFLTPTPVLSAVPGACALLTIFTASSASFVLPRFRRAIALLYQDKGVDRVEAESPVKITQRFFILPSSRRAIPFAVMARRLFGMASRILSKQAIASVYLPSSFSEYPLLASAKV